MQNRYASMEQNDDGTWAVFNDVTGLIIDGSESVTREQALNRMIEIYQHYSAIEFGKRSAPDES